MNMLSGFLKKAEILGIYNANIYQEVSKFSRAKKTIDDRIFLCAPLERFDDFLEIIIKELNFKNTERTEKQNIGSSRPKTHRT